jgi:IS30 family transposase
LVAEYLLIQKIITEVIKMDTSPQVAYDNLKLLEQTDVTNSAIYRELAQDILADPEVSLTWREAIADRLSQANHLLTTKSMTDEDSY